MRINLKYKNERIKLEVKPVSGIGKFTGLMFSKREKTDALLFDFKKPVKTSIHSFFVFYPFIAIWIDENNKIVKIRKILPFKLNEKPEKPFAKLIEIPINEKYREIDELLFGKISTTTRKV